MKFFAGFRKTRNGDELPVDMSGFRSFLGQQAEWIREHIGYERDMEHNLSKGNTILVRFSIEQYVSNFDSYFREKCLYRRKVEELFPLMVLVLVPEEPVAALIPRDIRKKLFAGLLGLLGSNTGVNPGELIKSHYKMIAGMKDTMTSPSPDAVLEILKECAELVDKLHDKKPEPRPSSLVNAGELLCETMKSFSLNSRARKKYFIRTLRNIVRYFYFSCGYCNFELKKLI